MQTESILSGSGRGYAKDFFFSLLAEGRSTAVTIVPAIIYLLFMVFAPEPGVS
jgi:hypothetical protein